MNLLKETLAVMELHGKTPDDVLWCGDGHDYTFDWKTFEENAREVDYNNGYGSQDIATDLMIVGTDWWLERSEYDGSESWAFKTMPVREEDVPMIDGVVFLGGGMWETLGELNTSDDEDDYDDWEDDEDYGDYE